MKHSWKRVFALFLTVAMTLSLLPTAAFAAGSSRAAGVIIDVTTYGADPSGAAESSHAIRAALAYAKTLPAEQTKTIVFPKGEYHFYDEYSESRVLYVSNTLRQNEPEKYRTKYIGILVEGMENVVIEGSGSQFIFHGNICTLGTIDSQNVTFQNFSMDHASPSVVDVTVESYVDTAGVILYVPPCYTYTINNGNSITWKGEAGPVSGQAYWSGNGNLGYCQGFNTITGQTTRSPGNKPFDNVSRIEQVEGDPTRLKITYSSAANRPTLGMCFQMRNPNPRMTPGTFFWQSDGVELNHIDAQFLHGFGMVGQLSKNITLDTVKFEARPGTGRTSAGFADFVQMSSVGGQVTIRDCEFSNPHDDPINIHGTFLKVTGISSDRRTVTVQYQHQETWGFPQYYPGDTVDFSAQGSMAPVANSAREVESVVNPGEGGNDLTTITVTLKTAIPDSITVNNYVMENVTYTPNVLIEGCRFVETPTRGILVTTRGKVVIQNNYFDRMGMAAIYISCDAKGWWESGRTENVLIKGNTFVVNPHTQAQAAIFVDPTGLGASGNRIHKDMVIEENVFNMDNVTHSINVNAVNARGVDGLTIRNNIIQRYQPGVNLTLSGNTSLNVGESITTQLTTGSPTTYTTQVFRLEQCEHITIANNVYDDGLNLGVELSGTNASNVTVTGDALNVGGSKQLAAVGDVSYYSSDPAVATVDASGTVTGVAPGTATITAYRTAGARTFESNSLTVTVSGTAAATPEKIEISGNDTVNLDGQLNFTANVTPSNAGSVVWAVKSAADGGSAEITQEGQLTATAPGVVEVTASLGGVTASKLVTVSKPNYEYLSDLDWTSATTGDPSWSVNTPLKDRSWESEKGNNGVRPIKVTGPNGEEVTFDKGIGTHAASTIVYNLAGLGYTQFTAKVGVSWYKHESTEPHLHFVVKCDGNQKYASAEMLGNTPYEEFTVDITGVNTLTLELTQPDNVYSAHGNWADAKLFTNNAAPTATSVTAAAGTGEVNLTYTYADNDRDAEADSLIAWYVSDTQDGHYTRIENADAENLTVNAALSLKWVKAVVVPQDATGRYGMPVESNAVQAPELNRVDNDATLSSLSAAGLTLSPAFDPQTTEYTLSVPAAAEKVTLTATATQAAAQVSGAGEVSLTGTKTTATITVTAPDGRTQKTYTVTINRAASSNATLSALTATAGSASITYNANTRFYEMKTDSSTLTFSATKADARAKVEVRFNAEELGTYEEASKTLNLTAGLNNLELRVTAEDGISTALYRVRVMKTASSDASLKSLTVGSQTVSVGDSGELGMVRVSGNSVTLNATAADGAAMHISAGGTAVENGGSIALTKAVTTVTIRVVAEDNTTSRTYTVTLVKDDPTNADLYQLKLGKIALSPAFDPAVTEYTATNYGNVSVTLDAIASQTGAKITYEAIADYDDTGVGSITGPVRFFKDEDVDNIVKVTVTSPDGSTTKTYTVAVDVVEEVYLCELDWVSAYAEWGTIQKHMDIEGKTPLKLLENGQETTYDHGIGTHASSTIVYDLSPMGFTRFTSKVGMDHSMASNTSQRLTFYVDVDDVNQYTSAGLGSTMDCGNVAIDITGGQQLALRVAHPGSNGSAHADWADAKLSSSIPLLSETADVPIKYLEFEHPGGDEHEHVIYVNASHANHSMELHPTFKPDGVSLSSHEISLSWRSSNTAVATVTAGENKMGVVTAVAPGRVEITATAVRGASASCWITVKQLLEGTPRISGDLVYGSRLSVPNEFNLADEHLTYTWYRGEGTSGTVLSNTNTYTPVKEDINQKLTVVISSKESSEYEGTLTLTTGVIQKMAGPALVALPSTTDVSREGEKDGTITGLFTGRHYEYKLESAETWTPFFKEGDEADSSELAGSAVISGLGVGTYLVRRAETDTHTAGPASRVTIDVHVEGAHKLTNQRDFENGRVESERPSIQAGLTVYLTVIPNEGYELETLEAVYTDEDGQQQTLTPELGEDGRYTFTMPGYDVTIQATFSLVTYTVVDHLSHIKCDMEDHGGHYATHGTPFTITLTPEEGYEMPLTLNVTVTDTGAETSDEYTYTRHETETEKRVLTFPNGVTSNITVTGEATLKTYTVVYNLTNGLTAVGAPQSVTHGNTLTVTLTAARGYNLPQEITVTVGGEELEADAFTYDSATGKVTVEKVSGNVEITAQGRAQGVALRNVTLVGPARVGRTLAADVGPVGATVEYQWILVHEDGTEEDLEDATEARFVIPASAEGKTIKVRITGTGSYEGVLTSEPTAVIQAAAEPFVFVEKVELDQTEAEVKVGKTLTLHATVTPDNATAPGLFWSSSNRAIATVDYNTGVVTGVEEGVVTITAESTDTVNSVAAYCVVTVTKDTQSPGTGGNTGGGGGTGGGGTGGGGGVGGGGGAAGGGAPGTRRDGAIVTTVTDTATGTTTETVKQTNGTVSQIVSDADGDVSITVTDETGEVLAEVKLPAATPTPDDTFIDLDPTPWAEDAINHMAGLKLVNGVGGSKYDPTASMTRGSLATVLFRLSQGKTNYAVTFKDVAKGQYYTEGVAWATKAGVVTGYSEDTFAPNDTITREQLAVMLARYAKLIGMDITADKTVLDKFVDGSATGGWAADGMAWCVEKGILQGKGANNLDPTAKITRAEVAVMLDRFIALMK